ncbi:hypothetical protein BH23PAT2_BH23PAT2_08480 [soil metagenome]
MNSSEKPQVIGGVEEYNSSEELQRAHRQTFVEAEKKEEEKQQLTEKQKLHRVLDKYIAKHGKSTEIRKMAKEGNRTADEQLDLSAELVEILEKIKNELR